MSKENNQYVTTHSNGWQVKGENNSKSTQLEKKLFYLRK